MEKLPRNERIAVLMKMLSDAPGRIFTLGNFSELFSSAKSTLSEDVNIVDRLLKKFEMGFIESIPGASGGVRFVPALGNTHARETVEELRRELSNPERILPGGYIYILDIIYNPEKICEISRIFSSRFYNKGVDYVITVETKGIPLAFMTARFLNVPLVIVRHYNEATDGSSVNINYVSGSSKKIQTMVLSLKALKRDSRLLFIDDFMKGGGTAKGISDLAREFSCELVGTGVLIETALPSKKMTDGYFSLLTLHQVDEEKGAIDIRSSMGNWS